MLPKRRRSTRLAEKEEASKRLKKAEKEDAKASSSAAQAKPEKEEEKLCPITLAAISTPYRLGCGHVFEEAAIMKWRETYTGMYSNCPVCRAPIYSRHWEEFLKSADSKAYAPSVNGPFSILDANDQIAGYPGRGVWLLASARDLCKGRLCTHFIMFTCDGSAITREKLGARARDHMPCLSEGYYIEEAIGIDFADASPEVFGSTVVTMKCEELGDKRSPKTFEVTGRLASLLRPERACLFREVYIQGRLVSFRLKTGRPKCEDL